MLYDIISSVFDTHKLPSRYADFVIVLEQNELINDAKLYELLYGDFKTLYNYLIDLNFDINWDAEKRLYERYSEDYYKKNAMMKHVKSDFNNNKNVSMEKRVFTFASSNNVSSKDKKSQSKSNMNSKINATDSDDELFDEAFYNLEEILNSDEFKNKLKHNTHAANFKDNPELFEQYDLNFDKEVFDQIVEVNQPLVNKVANNYQFAVHNTCLTYDDLVSYGNLGLFKAIEKFDSSLDNAFSTYATHWIKQSILRNIADYGYTVRIPVHLTEQINKLNKIECQHQQLHKEVCINQICRKAEITAEKYDQLKSIEWRFRHNVSTDTLINEESHLGDFYSIEDNILEQSVNEYTTPADEIIDTKIFNDQMKQQIRSILKYREYEVLVLRFGINDGIERTLEEIGTLFGVTRERIRQIEKKALLKLKEELAHLKEDI